MEVEEVVGPCTGAPAAAVSGLPGPAAEAAAAGAASSSSVAVDEIVSLRIKVTEKLLERLH
eukprot:10827309-Alexandrium_andersonii.AAC.1